MATRLTIARKRNAALRGERVSIKNIQRLMDYKSKTSASNMLAKIRRHESLPPEAPVLVDNVSNFTRIPRERIIRAMAS